MIRTTGGVGLPADGVRTVLEEKSYAAAVDTDWHRAMELGITAVLTHLCQGSRLTGFAVYEEFIRLIGKSRQAFLQNNKGGRLTAF